MLSHACQEKLKNLSTQIQSLQKEQKNQSKETPSKIDFLLALIDRFSKKTFGEFKAYSGSLNGKKDQLFTVSEALCKYVAKDDFLKQFANQSDEKIYSIQNEWLLTIKTNPILTSMKEKDNACFEKVINYLSINPQDGLIKLLDFFILHQNTLYMKKLSMIKDDTLDRIAVLVFEFLSKFNVQEDVTSKLIKFFGSTIDDSIKDNLEYITALRTHYYLNSAIKSQEIRHLKHLYIPIKELHENLEKELKKIDTESNYQEFLKYYQKQINDLCRSLMSMPAVYILGSVGADLRDLIEKIRLKDLSVSKKGFVADVDHALKITEDMVNLELSKKGFSEVAIVKDAFSAIFTSCLKSQSELECIWAQCIAEKNSFLAKNKNIFGNTSYLNIFNLFQSMPEKSPLEEGIVRKLKALDNGKDQKSHQGLKVVFYINQLIAVQGDLRELAYSKSSNSARNPITRLYYLLNMYVHQLTIYSTKLTLENCPLPQPLQSPSVAAESLSSLSASSPVSVESLSSSSVSSPVSVESLSSSSASSPVSIESFVKAKR